MEHTALQASAGLKPRLAELVKKDKYLKEMAFELGDDASPTNLMDSCLFRYWRAALDMNVYNAVRIKLGDRHFDDNKDWFRPMIASMCAVEEKHFRDQLGLKDILAEQDDYKDLASLKHSTFMNFVLEGSRFPNFDFQEHYRRDKPAADSDAQINIRDNRLDQIAKWLRASDELIVPMS